MDFLIFDESPFPPFPSVAVGAVSFFFVTVGEVAGADVGILVLFVVCFRFLTTLASGTEMTTCIVSAALFCTTGAVFTSYAYGKKEINCQKDDKTEVHPLH